MSIKYFAHSGRGGGNVSGGIAVGKVVFGVLLSGGLRSFLTGDCSDGGCCGNMGVDICWGVEIRP